MYICGSTNTRKAYKFLLPFKDVNPDEATDFCFIVSNKNEIVCTFFKRKEQKLFYMYILLQWISDNGW